MTLLQVLRVALRALARAKMRSFLTTLGIVIGVSAVIAMVAIGEGAKKRVEDAFASMGSDLLIVLPGTTTRGGANGIPAFAESNHPVFRTHEETGRKAMYVNRLMTVRIEGLPEEESEALLNTLFDQSEKPEFVYRHVWRVGDLLVWDNRCSTHARDDFPADQRRLMLRTTVKGTVKPY